MNFEGVVTALVTPFKNGRVDHRSLKRLVKSQMDSGIAGYVVNGTTAESPTLSTEEVEKIFKTVKSITDGSVPLILGAGSNSTAQTVKNMKLVNRLRADSALVVVPYYNKPPQNGMYEHFKAVAAATKRPIILYNVPGRTIVSMNSDTISKLSKTKNIIGIKEASGDMKLLKDIKKKTKSNFLLSSGDDVTCMEFARLGGQGVISVISHLIPSEMVNILGNSRNKLSGSSQAYKKYDRLNRLMGIEPNPMPVKMGLYLNGLIDSPELRLPLVTLSKKNTVALKKEMKRLGLL